MPKASKVAARGNLSRLAASTAICIVVRMLPRKRRHIEVKFLRGWFPDLPEEQIREIEESYIRYLEIRLRIFERIEAQKSDAPETGLTGKGASGINKMKDV